MNRHGPLTPPEPPPDRFVKDPPGCRNAAAFLGVLMAIAYGAGWCQANWPAVRGWLDALLPVAFWLMVGAALLGLCLVAYACVRPLPPVDEDDEYSAQETRDPSRGIR